MNRMNPYHLNHGPDLTDYGPEPFVANIGRAAKQNCNYRAALWTGTHLQFTLMSIPPGGDIGLEAHPDLEQFLRVEDGFGLVKMGAAKDKLNYQKDVCGGYAVFVPAGTWHNIINTGSRPLKLCSVYSPPEHPHGTIQATKQEAEYDEQHEYIEDTEPVEQERYQDFEDCVEHEEFVETKPCCEYSEPEECCKCAESCECERHCNGAEPCECEGHCNGAEPCKCEDE